MNDLSMRHPELAQGKLERLPRLKQKARTVAYAPPLRRRAPSVSHPPLSFAQQRLWLVEQFAPGNVAYNMPLAVRLSGRVNVSTLKRCLGEIVRRHEILRTTFRNTDGQPVQVISPPPPNVSLPVVDLGDLPEAAWATEVALHRRREAQTCFDLAEGPLWRAKLLRLGAEEHVALFTLHHAISDGWSMGVLVREVALLYKAFSAGQSSPLEELPVQYADYAVWQREWLRGDVLDAQLEYWRGQLADAPARLELPTDRPHTQNRTTGGALYSFTVPREVGAKLKEVGRREEATLFMVMLAAFGALLSRYSGQEDILIGTVIGGRQRVELERLIGFFVGTLVMRADLSGNPSFRELLRRVRESTLGAYAHQDVPFEKLVEELQPERSLSQTPLFQVLLVMQNVPHTELNLEGLRMEWLEAEPGAAKFDLSLVAGEGEKGLVGTFVYSTDLFDGPTIARMAERFQNFLRDAAGRPDLDVGALAAMSRDESRQLLSAFNAELE